MRVLGMLALSESKAARPDKAILRLAIQFKTANQTRSSPF